MSWLANRAGDWLIAGIEPERLGNAHPSIVPYETFHASDGYINLASGTDDHFRRFCIEAGRDDLAADPRYRTNRGRVEHREELVPELQRLISTRTVAEWVELLERARVPGGPVLSIPETFAGPAAHMVEQVTHPTAGQIGLVRSPVRLADGRPGRAHPAATAGRARRRGADRARLLRCRARRAARRGVLPGQRVESGLPARMWRNW